jgi:hypothetical protein
MDMDLFYFLAFVGLVCLVVHQCLGGGVSTPDFGNKTAALGGQKHTLINPATGLVMNGFVDVGGHAYGSDL